MRTKTVSPGKKLALRLFIVVTTFVCLVTVLQLSAAAQFPLSSGVSFTIKTYKNGTVVNGWEVDNAGTDDGVYASLRHVDGSLSSEYHMDSSSDDHDNGDCRTYDGPTSSELGSPWEYKAVCLRLDGGDAWIPEYATVTFSNNSSITAHNWNALQLSTDSDEGSASRDFSIDLRRKFTSFNGFDSWSGEVLLSKSNVSPDVNTTYTWDGKVNDSNYGTYNAFSYSFAPNLSLNANGVPSNCYSFTVPTSSKTGSFVINRQVLYNYMKDNNKGTCNFDFTLAFDSRTVSNSPASWKKTITVRCCTYGISASSASMDLTKTFKASTDNYFFNLNKLNVTIKVDVSDAYTSTTENAARVELTKNFTCTPKLYMGNGDDSSKLLCTMTQTSNAASGGTTLTFTGSIPITRAFDSNGAGISLVLDNINTNVDGKAFVLRRTDTEASGASCTLTNRTDGDKLVMYFAKTKVDTASPTISMTDSTGSITDITGPLKVSKSKNFWLVGSETLYSTAAEDTRADSSDPSVHNYTNKAIYEVYGTTYKRNTDGSLTKSGETRIGSSSEIGITGSADPGNSRTLNPTSETYGSYTVKVTASDVAGNPVTKTYAPIFVDKYAPVVTLTNDNVTQNTDSSMQFTGVFNISDLCADIDNGLYNTSTVTENDTVFARVYYMFTDGEYTAPTGTPAQSGGIESTIGKWGFVESDTARTVILKVAPDKSFYGKLYYYGEDSLGNKTAVQSRNISMNNLVPRAAVKISEGECVYDTDTFTFTYTDTRSRSEYTIEVVPDTSDKVNGNGTPYADLFDETDIFYKWESAGTAPATNQDWMRYTKGDTSTIGNYMQYQMQAEDIKLNGDYKLLIKLIHNVSGREIIITSDSVFYFDSEAPVTTETWTTAAAKALAVQTVRFTGDDRSGLESASLYVSNPDDTATPYIVGTETLAEGTEYSVPLTTATVGALARLDKYISLSMSENGVYKLNTYAADQNGFDTTNKDELLFAIRVTPPTAGTPSCSVTEKLNDELICSSQNYTITADITDSFKNLDSLTTEQYVLYSASTDGINWGEWKKYDTAMTKNASENKLTASVAVDSPVTLVEGKNDIYLRFACVNDGDTSTVDAMAVKVAPVSIIYDTTGPKFVVSYSDRDGDGNVTRTNEDVTATVTLTDTNYSADVLTLTDEAETEGLTIADGETAGTFIITVDKNMTVSLTAKDKLENISLVPISVSSIDKEAPTVSMTAPSYSTSGEKTYANVTVTANDAVSSSIEFALIPTDKEELEESDFTSYAETSKYFIASSNATGAVIDGEQNVIHSITMRGIKGSYVLAMRCEDILGNKVIKTFEDNVITLTDPEPEITEISSELEMTKSTSVTNLTFNTKLAVLPRNMATGETDEENFEILTSYDGKTWAEIAAITLTGSEDHEAGRRIYVADECGRCYTLTFNPPTKYFEGFSVSYSFTENGEPMTAGEKFAFTDADEITLTVTPNEDYTEQHFLFDPEIDTLSGFEFDSTASVFVPESAEGAGDGNYYTTLVFNALHDKKSTKSASFRSYTDEGNEDEKTQQETLSIYTIDETDPVVVSTSDGVSTFTHTADTINNVSFNLVASDPESGIAEIRFSDNGTDFMALGTTNGSSLTFGDVTVTRSFSGITVVFAQDGKLYSEVENNVGFMTDSTFTVSGIDKTAIEKDKHYTVDYYYENYLGEWTKITDMNDGKTYRSVKAVLVFPENSGKTMSVATGEGEVILTATENSYIFRMKDLAGNTASQRVTVSDFDTISPILAPDGLSTDKKTNEPLNIYVDIRDDKNTIAFVSACDSDGNNIPLAEGTPTGNSYGFTVSRSDTFTVTAYDNAGNKGETSVTVTNYNDVAPRLVISRWSTNPDILRDASYEGTEDDPAAIPVSGSVSVMLKYFDKEVHMSDGKVDYESDGSVALTGESVKLTAVYPSSPLTDADIAFDLSTKTILFKKNGTAIAEFIDEYGNTGRADVSVTTINTSEPSMEAKVTVAADLLSAAITFEQKVDEYDISLDPLMRDEDEFYVYYAGDTSNEKVSVADFERTVSRNGVYKFVIFDDAGLTQTLNVKVEGIDDAAPVVTGVDINYDYLTDKGDTVWESENKEIAVEEKYISDDYVGYTASTDIYVGTNSNVTVTVETDKVTRGLGTNDELKKQNSMVYADNGMYNFNLTAANGNLVSYSVDIELIDKDAPVLSFAGANELMYIEGTSADRNSKYAFDKDALIDFAAYDLKNEEMLPLTDKVYVYQIVDDKKLFIYKNGTWCGESEIAEYEGVNGSHVFNPFDISKNEWSRNRPYYLYYTVFDSVGNETTVRRTIRLVGFYDTIVLANGALPSVENVVVVGVGETVSFTLQNFSGISYARYAKGYKTMGEMKYSGKVLPKVDGGYKLYDLNGGEWYTVFMQTDKRDYFTIYVYVNNDKVSG